MVDYTMYCVLDIMLRLFIGGILWIEFYLIEASANKYPAEPTYASEVTVPFAEVLLLKLACAVVLGLPLSVFFAVSKRTPGKHWTRYTFCRKMDEACVSASIFMLVFHGIVSGKGMKVPILNAHDTRLVLCEILTSFFLYVLILLKRKAPDEFPAPERQERDDAEVQSVGNPPLGLSMSFLLRSHEKVNYTMYCVLDIMFRLFIGGLLGIEFHLLAVATYKYHAVPTYVSEVARPFLTVILLKFVCAVVLGVPLSVFFVVSKRTPGKQWTRYTFCRKMDEACFYACILMLAYHGNACGKATKVPIFDAHDIRLVLCEILTSFFLYVLIFLKRKASDEFPAPGKQERDDAEVQSVGNPPLGLSMSFLLRSHEKVNYTMYCVLDITFRLFIGGLLGIEFYLLKAATYKYHAKYICVPVAAASPLLTVSLLERLVCVVVLKLPLSVFFVVSERTPVKQWTRYTFWRKIDDTCVGLSESPMVILFAEHVRWNPTRVPNTYTMQLFLCEILTSFFLYELVLLKRKAPDEFPAPWKQEGDDAELPSVGTPLLDEKTTAEDKQ